MRYSEQIKPISYLKANMAEVMVKLTESGEVSDIKSVVQRLKNKRK